MRYLMSVQSLLTEFRSMSDPLPISIRGMRYLMSVCIQASAFFVDLVQNICAHVVKLVYTLSSGGSAFGCGGSSPLMRTVLADL